MNCRAKGRELFQVRYLGNGLHEVRQRNEAKYPECGVKAASALAARPTNAAGDQPQGDAGNIIDVMVVYTPAARAAALPGGNLQQQQANMSNLINTAVSESNTAYQQSSITPRIRLVYQGEVAYTESSDFLANLDRVTNPSDGFLDEVQGLRNTYGADLVSLWIDNGQFWRLCPFDQSRDGCFRKSRLQRRLLGLCNRLLFFCTRNGPQHGLRSRQRKCGRATGSLFLFVWLAVHRK